MTARDVTAHTPEELVQATGEPKVGDTRSCNCHPDDNPPVPCPRKFALSECRHVSLIAQRDELREENRQLRELARDFSVLQKALVGETGKSAILAANSLRSQRDALVEALTFYADEDNHGHFGAVESDNGYRARTAIAKAMAHKGE